jgi:hypothetical protein
MGSVPQASSKTSSVAEKIGFVKTGLAGKLPNQNQHKLPHSSEGTPGPRTPATLPGTALGMSAMDTLPGGSHPATNIVDKGEVAGRYPPAGSQ